MPEWKVTPDHGTARAGVAATLADAWSAAHAAASEIVLAGTLTRMVLDVDGARSTIEPGDSGDHEADTRAVIDIIAAGRSDVVSAYVGRSKP